MANSNIKIIDTNVICMTDNTNYNEMSREEAECAIACSNFVFNFIHSRDSSIALDSKREIVQEYARNIRKGGQPTLATEFMKWLYTYIARMPATELIDLIKTGDNIYETFPDDIRLNNFDPSDRKFIALAKTHPHHPPIIQGTDSKWWGYKDILHELGIDVKFLCEKYIIMVYTRKMEV